MRTSRTTSNEARRKAYMREFKKNISYYEAHKREFLRTYRNRYIAIIEERIVDEDRSLQELTGRMVQAFGDEPFFIAEVREKRRVVHIPSVGIIAKEAILR